MTTKGNNMMTTYTIHELGTRGYTIVDGPEDGVYELVRYHSKGGSIDTRGRRYDSLGDYTSTLDAYADAAQYAHMRDQIDD